MKKTKIICVVGATASGKTALGVLLAKAVGGEIISADSMQVYKDMPIATAAATDDEKQGVPHYLLEFLDSGDSFSVAEFVKLAKEKITDIASRGKVPIIVGGTGLFVDSLVQNIEFADISADESLRAELNGKSTDELYAMLRKDDPTAAANIHKNNRKRVIRALELAIGGTTKTEQNDNSRLADNPYDALYIGIGYKNRRTLYDRINRRVDIMIENGLLDEAKKMLSRTATTAKQAIGHKELSPYLSGEISLEDATENIKRVTRRYAKRQLTWFRRNEKINWLYADEMTGDALVKTATAVTKEFLNK